MIGPESRYANAVVEVVEDDRGKHQSVSIPLATSRAVRFTYYQVEEDDTIEWLAFLTYGDGRLWWIIADANPEILDWTALTIGSIIRVPNA